MVIEGPIVTVIAGFLTSLGFLNGIATYLLLVIGDLIGDVLHYALGLYWNHSSRINKFARWFGYDENKEHLIEEHFKYHKGKTLFLAKLAHGVGGAVQVASGIVRVNFWQFLWFNLLGTIPKTLLFFLIGFYAGNSYNQIDIYLTSVAYASIAFFVICILLGIFLTKFSKKFFNQK